jgi:predicted nucleic acid-binding protein
MAARAALVDSSFFIGRMRANADPLAELNAASEDWEIVTCGMVVLEVCRGFKHESQRRKYEQAFSLMCYVPTHNRIWQRAAQLAWMLDRKGLYMQPTDLLIATHALHVDAAVLTHDSDFERVPGLRVIDSLD